MNSLAAAAPVPAPLFLVAVLHVLTLVLHWAAMNVLIACAWHLATARASEHELLRRMTGSITPALSLTVTFGVAPLLFLQLIHGERFYASSIFMAWPWLGSLLVLMIGYYAAYACDGRMLRGRPMPSWMRALPLLGVAVFGFVITANVALSEHPQVMKGLGEAGWAMALSETHAVPRFLHQMVGALALGQIFLTIIGHRMRERGHSGGDAFSRRAAKTAVWATVVGILLGGWQLMAAPKDVGGALPGATLTFGILFGLGATAATWWAWKRPGRKPVLFAVVFGFLTIVCKVVMKLAIRERLLDRAEVVRDLETATQVGPIVLFGVCFVIALLVSGWLVRVMFSARPMPHHPKSPSAGGEA